jgi:lantibiotic modifying enzyme
MQQALAKAPLVASERRAGLYTGWLGVVLAGARVADLLDEPELRREACQLLDGAIEAPRVSRAGDLLSGAAGTIVGLLALSRSLDRPDLLNAAVAAADRLVASARGNGGALSWPWPAFPEQPDLCGLSHGASGPGLALLDVYDATAEPRFAEAAERAFAYEHAWFDPVAGNWPDLRGLSLQARPGDALPFASLWCHGAPGIALARLRARDLLPGTPAIAEAEVALRTARQSIEARQSGADAGFGLCHGLAGNADVLLSAASRGVGTATSMDLAHRVAAEGIERYGRGEPDWPVDGPGLMCGLAGVGYFCLRLARPETPSVLLFDTST